MKKKTKENWFLAHKKTTVLGLGMSLALIAGLYFVMAKIAYVYEAANQASSQASMAHVRELLMMPIEDLKKDVPVDPKTGDLYFPESRLFLPNPKSDLKLTYAWSPSDGTVQEELSVSLSRVPGTTSLYSAKNMEDMFKELPKLQSCSRGAKLFYSKPTNVDPLGQLKKAVTLQNGKELYIYVEKDCPELDKVVDILSGVRSY